MGRLQATDLLLTNRASVDYRASFTDVKSSVLDSHVIHGNAAPTKATYPDITDGTIWVDTSKSPPALNVWDPAANSGAGGWQETGGGGSKPINPTPADVSASPAFVGGTGTQADPFILTPETVGNAGGTASSLQTLTIHGRVGGLVDFTDSSSGANGARFVQSTSSIGSSGAWVGKLHYLDTPGSTTAATYMGNLQIGTVYFLWVITQSTERAPVISTVTLADSPEATRFTSASFSTTVAMADEGSPKATRGFKAFVEAALKAPVVTDTITTVTTTAKFTNYELRVANPRSPAQVGTVDLVNQPWTSWTSNRVGQVPSTGFDSYTLFQVRLASPGTPAFGQISSGSTSPNNYMDLYAAWSDDGITWTPLVVVCGYVPGYGDVTSYVPPAAARYWIFCTTPKHSTTIGSGITTAFAAITTSFQLQSLQFASNKGLASLAGKDPIEEVGGGSDARAHVASVDLASNSMYISGSTGTWNSGSTVKGPVKAAVGGALTKLYCKLDLNLNVTDLTGTDPGFTSVTGAGPYVVRFPATLPSGDTPDVEIPAGGAIVTEVQAENDVGSVYKMSNQVTPS